MLNRSDKAKVNHISDNMIDVRSIVALRPTQPGNNAIGNVDKAAPHIIIVFRSRVFIPDAEYCICCTSIGKNNPRMLPNINPPHDAKIN